MGRVLAILVLALAGTAAAKPMYRRPPPPPVDGAEMAARLTEAIRNRDVAGVRALLADEVTHEALWFADAGCAKRFAEEGKLDGGELRALAKCLAQQKPIATTRRSSHIGGGVLTFAPGIEIEVLFSGGRARWLGRPRLTVQAFEGLRRSGTTQLDTALAGKLTEPAFAWIETCLDAKGGIASKRFLEGKGPSAGVGDIFLAAIGDWTFRPFQVRRTTTPICSLTRLDYPAGNAPAVEVLPRTLTAATTVMLDKVVISPFDRVQPTQPQHVPPTVLERLRIRGTKQILPDARTKAAIVRAGKATVVASIKLCVDATGRVSDLKPLKSSGFTAYDRKLERDMWRWAYRPYRVRGVATPACTAVTFVYRP